MIVFMIIGITTVLIIMLMIKDRMSSAEGYYKELERVGEDEDNDIMRDNYDMINSTPRGFKYSGMQYDKYHQRKSLGQIKQESNVGGI
jgi:hypothetical protein